VEANRATHNARVEDYRDGRRDKLRTTAHVRTQEVKAETIAAYGGVCVCCGVADLVFLTIDHPEGDGAAHRRELFGGKGRGGERFYRWLRRNGWPAGYRVLCWNCQHATFRGVCPHQQV
jgi:hypothetical protein